MLLLFPTKIIAKEHVDSIPLNLTTSGAVRLRITGKPEEILVVSEVLRWLMILGGAYFILETIYALCCFGSFLCKLRQTRLDFIKLQGEFEDLRIKVAKIESSLKP